VPGLAEVYLVGIADSGGGVDDDFVADEQDGFWPGFVGGSGRFGWRGAGFFTSIEGDKIGCHIVLFAEDDIGEHDRGVGICISVDGGDLGWRDGGEEADGEGWAIAADHACGDEGEVVFGIGGGVGSINDRGEPDVDGAFDDHLPDARGHSLDEFTPSPCVEPFDEGDGVEELDGCNFGRGLGIGCGWHVEHGWTFGVPAGHGVIKNHEIGGMNRLNWWHRRVLALH